MSDILIVEDQPHFRAILKTYLLKNQYSVDEATDLETARKKLSETHFDVVILDIKLPDGNSIDLFDQYPDKLADRTIVITANATIPGVIKAIRKGAFNYLEKPVEPELLLTQVRKIIELNRLEKMHRTVVGEFSSNFTFDQMVYKSPKMSDIVNRARILAGTDNTILLEGETGCGKEVLAHSIHHASKRRNQVFLPVNCASVPEDLFESELFGFEKGAFTGATSSYCGRFLQADKGTLFLDEIGELPLHIQAKLLRVLDERVIYRLKSAKPAKIDVRLIFATNRDLVKSIQCQHFRSDLYYRLQEASLTIPPLRERSEDILALAYHFIQLYSHISKKEVTRMSAEVEAYFLSYPWQGNVRELKNTIKSVIPFKTDHTIRMEDLAQSSLLQRKDLKNEVLTLDQCEKRHIHRVLKLTDFNIKRTARLLGISRPRLYRKMKEYELGVGIEEGQEES